jgi:hypothetical protein
MRFHAHHEFNSLSTIFIGEISVSRVNVIGKKWNTFVMTSIICYAVFLGFFLAEWLFILVQTYRCVRDTWFGDPKKQKLAFTN